MNRFNVTPGREEDFVEAFSSRAKLIDTMPGFLGLDVMRPFEGNIFISCARWESREHFEAWTKSEQFKQSHRRAHPGLVQGHPVLECYEVFDSTFVKSGEQA